MTPPRIVFESYIYIATSRWDMKLNTCMNMQVGDWVAAEQSIVPAQPSDTPPHASMPRLSAPPEQQHAATQPGREATVDSGDIDALQLQVQELRQKLQVPSSSTDVVLR